MISTGKKFHDFKLWIGAQPEIWRLIWLKVSFCGRISSLQLSAMIFLAISVKQFLKSSPVRCQVTVEAEHSNFMLQNSRNQEADRQELFFRCKDCGQCWEADQARPVYSMECWSDLLCARGCCTALWTCRPSSRYCCSRLVSSNFLHETVSFAPVW